jgi:molecular chaperone DnaK
MQASMKLGEAIYAQQQSEGEAAAAADAASDAADDDVIDADFEDVGDDKKSA